MSIADILNGIIVVLADTAYAASDPCVGLPGDWCNPEHTLGDIAPVVAPILVGFAAGAAMLFTVVGGAQMLLSFGDDSKATKGKMSIIYALGGFIIAMAAQSIMAFVREAAEPLASSFDNPVVVAMGAAVRAMVSLFNVTFFTVIIYAAFRLLLAHGKSDEFTKAMNIILWAVAGAIVVNVSHALVSLIAAMY